MGSLDSGYYDEVNERSAAKAWAFKQSAAYKEVQQRKAECDVLLKVCRRLPLANLNVNDVTLLMQPAPEESIATGWMDMKNYYTEPRLLRLREIAAKGA